MPCASACSITFASNDSAAEAAVACIFVQAVKTAAATHLPNGLVGVLSCRRQGRPDSYGAGAPGIIQRVRTRPTAQPGNAGEEPAAAIQAARRGGCGCQEPPPPCSGITLSEEEGQGERWRTRDRRDSGSTIDAPRGHCRAGRYERSSAHVGSRGRADVEQ